MKLQHQAMLGLMSVLLFPLDTAVAADLFSAAPVWSSGTVVSGGDGIARWIDVDNDGDLDFVTSAPNPKRWVLYQNNDGQLDNVPSWESAETTDCDHIDVLDFNHDGWADLAATHESHCTLYFNKLGRFEALPDWETGMIANANQIDFGDFDSDGDFDMLMAGGEPVNGIALFRNDEGVPAKLITIKLGHVEYSETAIFADVDHDNDLDIVAGYRGGTLVLFRNTDAEFDAGTVIHKDTESPWTQRLYWMDLNQNGGGGLYCAKGPWGNATGRSAQLFPAESGSSYQPQWTSSARTAFHGLEFGDVDNDGDVDMVAADYASGGRLMVFLNRDGTLQTQPAWSRRTSGPAHEAVLGDIDGDGDLDIAVGCRDQAHVYENLTVQSVPDR